MAARWISQRKVKIEEAIDEIVSVSGRLDVLFNNAGRPMTRPVTQITPQEFRDLIALNLTGVIMGTLKAIGIMEKQGSGYVVNTASAGGLIPAPYQCAYGSTKTGVIELTAVLPMNTQVPIFIFLSFHP